MSFSLTEVSQSILSDWASSLWLSSHLLRVMPSFKVAPWLVLTTDTQICSKKKKIRTGIPLSDIEAVEVTSMSVTGDFTNTLCSDDSDLSFLLELSAVSTVL